MKFQKPTLEDKEKLKPYFEHVDEMSCELTFASMVLWAEHYGIEYTILNNMLVPYSTIRHTYGYPLGEGDLKETLTLLIEENKKEGKPFQLHGITEKRFAALEEMFPDQFSIEYNRDEADYIYLSEKLATLAGKKMHGKRNHINRFKEAYTDWSYERITKESIPECIKMAQDWRKENECDQDPEKSAELCVALNFLRHFDELGVVGGLIRAEGRVIAFTIGEPVREDTFVVHIEKAYAEIQGAYPMINQQFAADYGIHYQYMNREEDTGSEGLRKAKLSYRPEILLEKGVARLK